MTNILLIEDDDHKRQQLSEYVRAVIPTSAINTAKSFRAGASEAIKGGWDLIILDVSMPSFDIGRDEHGGRPQVYAGLDILRQMRRLAVVCPVVVVTQYDQFEDGDEMLTLAQVESRLRDTHPDAFRGLVYYNPVFSDWKRHLNDFLGSVLPNNVPRDS